MRYVPQYSYLCLLAAVVLAVGCQNHHDKASVEAAMQRYDRLIQKMDADSISQLYTADGDLGGIVYGRDSIRKFLSSFKNVQVLDCSSTSDTIDIKGDSSLQTGAYTQTAVVDKKDTLHLKGRYRTNWQWVAGAGWQIKRMRTYPIQ